MQANASIPLQIFFVPMVTCFIGVCVYPNTKKRKGRSCIRIGLRVSGKFGGWVESNPREGDVLNKNRIIGKEIIFGRVNYFGYFS